MTQEDIGGTNTDYINDADLRNAPDITAFRRGVGGVPTLLVTGRAFERADRNRDPPDVSGRRTGEAGDVPTRAPEFMRLRVSPNQPRIPGPDLDFLYEAMAQIFDRGNPVPKRMLRFTIEVTDHGR